MRAFPILVAAVLAPPGLPAQEASRVRLGIEVLLQEKVELVQGRRLGLITNPSGVDSKLVATVDRLFRDPRLKLVQLFGPEHGIRGDAPAGEKVEDSRDPVTGLLVESLYGKARRPSKPALQRIDVLLFDIQDVGSRTYTYASTLGEALKAAKESGLRFMVLDRPNPQGGLLHEGPVQTEAHASFIGWGPVPVTHGMTFGELARFYNGELDIGCELQVVPMSGWRRAMHWEDTGLIWVPTSPHIPHALHAHLYVATGMVGGVTRNVNEGVGFTLPFECIAAEWIQGARLAEALTLERLPGVSFRPITYTPSYGRFQGKTLHGVHLHLTDRRSFRPLHTALTLLCTLERHHPGMVEFIDEPAFLRHWTDPELIHLIRAKKTATDIEARWADDHRRFAERRRKYLLYD
jgi:uncharacterized protein YbbC (DUF1343 family)